MKNIDAHITALESLLIRFHQVGRELPPLDRLGITPAQVVYLDFLAKHPGCTLSELTDAVQFKPASVSVMVSNLESKALLVKESDSEDNRLVRIRLTERGDAVVEEMRAFRRSKLKQMLRNLDETEQAMFIELFERALQTDQKSEE